MKKKAVSRLLPSNRLARSISILAGGTAAAQAIVVLASPVLTRMYSPDGFGLLAVFTSLLAIPTVLASLRYHFAIPLPDSGREAAHVAVLCQIIVGIVVLVVAAVVAFYRDEIAAAFQMPALSSYLWLLPLALLFAGTYEILSLWAIRERVFKAVARTKLNQSLAMTAVQCASFLLGPLGLLLGKTAQQMTGVGTLGTLTLKKHWGDVKSTRLADISSAAVRYRNFPLYSTWGGLANKIGSEVPALAFAAFFSPAAAGYYALAYRVSSLPMSVVGRAVADAFYSEAVGEAKKGRIGALVSLVHQKLALIAMPPAVVLFVAGPDLFETVFGGQWREAGHVVRWLAPMLYAQFCVAPVIRTLIALEQQASEAFLQVLLVGARLGAIAFGVYLENFLAAVIGYSAASVVVYGLYYGVIMIRCDQSLRGIWRPTAMALAASSLMTGPLLILVALDVTPMFVTLSALGTGLIIIAYYYLMLGKSRARKNDARTTSNGMESS